MYNSLYTLLPNLIGFIIAIIALIVALRIRKSQPMSIGTSHRITALQQEVASLRNEIVKLEATVTAQTAEIERLKLANIALGNSLADTMVKARASDEQLHAYLVDRIDKKDKLDSDMLVLIVMTADADIDLDITKLRAAAQRGGFRITRLYPATFDDLRRKLNRNRQMGDPIKYIHIAAHMSHEGIQLDRLVTVAELSEVLADAEILVLSGCRSDVMGDYLGVVPTVISMREQISHADAAVFTQVFWEEVAKHYGNGAAALETTLERVPTNVAEFVELHI